MSPILWLNYSYCPLYPPCGQGSVRTKCTFIGEIRTRFTLIIKANRSELQLETPSNVKHESWLSSRRVMTFICVSREPDVTSLWAFFSAIFWTLAVRMSEKKNIMNYWDEYLHSRYFLCHRNDRTALQFYCPLLFRHHATFLVCSQVINRYFQQN